jgi:hypothetical protein
MLETEIKKLTAAIEALTQAIAPLTIDAIPVEDPVTEEPVAEKPATKKLKVKGKMDEAEVIRKCLELSRADPVNKECIKDKLREFGVKRVSELVGNENYDAFCDYLCILGNIGETQ